jgi:hypothetical protein
MQHRQCLWWWEKSNAPAAGSSSAVLRNCTAQLASAAQTTSKQTSTEHQPNINL